MPAIVPDTIFPCPFSKGYGIPASQAWLLLKAFLIYRFMLACLFIILFYSSFGPSLLGANNHQLYLYSSAGYLILSILSGICIFRRLTGYILQAQLLIFTDILILTLLMHACGGIKSGMGILLAVSIASGGLLIGGRCAMFFAALASLAVLTEQIFADYAQGLQTASYTYAGMLGASYFTIALLSYILAQRSEQILQLANQQKQTISKLEELNQYIIQHMQSGIIIAGKDETIQMANEASLRLAHLRVQPGNLASISKELSLAFQGWLADSEQNLVLLQLPDQSEIPVRFMLLPTRHEILYMIILENITLYNQRLQQSKLASLGQLTASIAHEIRNPLGAISHAGQLLSENPRLSSQDRRLTEIIQTHSTRVNHIIEDILQLSRRTASNREKLQLKPWLNNYMKNFILEHAVNADTFKASHTDESLCALMDPNHLKQILDNLCQNALKYGKPEVGQILLSARRFQQMPCIEVIDNGGGISHEHISHLFEPFFTTSPSGTGLGLYISKGLAELNQAKLSYHLTDDKQSCFRLCLLDAEHKIIEI
ncbi:Signal transduction histidine kinase [Candidatus Methylobacter favarea]|uniref:histidine kinase n=1 Tax=Candidatus Methylobacter favarea TaxID=2707345 RepID=A0A8S0WY11_9GAMM|nr:HAMP domain-containing sensor histidine kinase [Candidatus Methylobacter favarea]CAA9889393.1 Signal transduction histidine kinase [Candidatus Methylobacter favarea]